MRLFDEFSTADEEEWKRLAKLILKESDLSTLDWSYDPDVMLHPYYDALSLENSHSKQRNQLRSSAGWVTLEPLAGITSGSAEALVALNMGAGGFLFDDDAGVFEAEMFKDIYPEHCFVGLRLAKSDNVTLDQLRTWLDSRNVNTMEFRGLVSASLDLNKDLKEILADSLELAGINLRTELLGNYPNIKTIEVRADILQMAGATITQQLAYMLASLRVLADASGQMVNQLPNKIVLTLSVDRDFYHEIAKVRSARLLAFKLFVSYGVNISPDDIFVLGITSPVADSWLDPNTNYLRKTTQAMSAVMGGVNALVISPNNANKANDFDRRIARNISNIIRDESYLDKVPDPLAGTYFIEQLTDRLSEAAWLKFKEIEGRGGLGAYISSGAMEQDLKENISQGVAAIAKRRQRMVGVNDYPNLQEVPKPAMDQEQNAGWMYRPAAKMEQLVDKVLSMGIRPVVLPLTIGDDAVMKSARMNFTVNFLGCFGFEMNSPVHIDDKGKLAKADIIVICGADDDYVNLSAEVVNHVKQHCKALIVAGYPTQSIDQLRSMGVDFFIHRKNDLIVSCEEIINLLITKGQKS